jgi:hypothetical protein
MAFWRDTCGVIPMALPFKPQGMREREEVLLTLGDLGSVRG